MGPLPPALGLPRLRVCASQLGQISASQLGQIGPSFPHPLTSSPEEEGAPSHSLARAARARRSLSSLAPSASGSPGLKAGWRSRALGDEYWAVALVPGQRWRW